MHFRSISSGVLDEILATWRLVTLRRAAAGRCPLSRRILPNPPLPPMSLLALLLLGPVAACRLSLLFPLSSFLSPLPRLTLAPFVANCVTHHVSHTQRTQLDEPMKRRLRDDENCDSPQDTADQSAASYRSVRARHREVVASPISKSFSHSSFFFFVPL